MRAAGGGGRQGPHPFVGPRRLSSSLGSNSIHVGERGEGRGGAVVLPTAPPPRDHSPLPAQVTHRFETNTCTARHDHDTTQITHTDVAANGARTRTNPYTHFGKHLTAARHKHTHNAAKTGPRRSTTRLNTHTHTHTIGTRPGPSPPHPPPGEKRKRGGARRPAPEKRETYTHT